MDKKTQIINLFKKGLIVNGATGTNLQSAGMVSGLCPEMWALENGEILQRLQRQYREAGAQVIYTFTFGANRIKLSEYGLGEKTAEINCRHARLAKESAGDGCFVAGSVGPLGKFIAPFGTLPFEEAVSCFKEQIAGLVEGGVDYIAIETMIDLQEARAALIAAKEVCSLPVCVSMTYEHGRTLTGNTPVTSLVTLQSLGADAVGCNCSTGPLEMIPLIEAMKPYAEVPLLAQPNAGMPRLAGGRTFFDVGPVEFALAGAKLAEAGASILGGCCGTTPAHIAALVFEVKWKEYKPGSAGGILCGPRRHIKIGTEERFALIGERINPTGKKQLQQELQNGNYDYVAKLALDQEREGASILDVNSGAPGISEIAALEQIVPLLAHRCDLPLCIDTTTEEALEKALRAYCGRALINSVPAENEKMERLLPLVQRYGAMFIALPIDRKIPETAAERIALAQKIIKRAAEYGIEKGRIVIDALALTVSSSPDAAKEALKVMGWAKEQGIASVIGLSNISFGLPQRPAVNAAFLAMAMAGGLSMAIANPQSAEIMASLMASRALLSKEGMGEYIASFSSEAKTESSSLFDAIVLGERSKALAYAEKELPDAGPKNLIEKSIIPALNRVGELFEKQEYFLPQLVASAEAAKAAFSLLELKTGEKNISRPAVVMATVKGDMHDIGKNIVCLILGNHGYKIVDLGKDVDAQTIVEAVRRENAAAVGLSALITTTMAQMPVVIAALRENGLILPVMVGGAVVTQQYADEIGAYYAKDATGAVDLLKNLIG
ncbi:MAG: homocysteine S-methyltransferase family protein [Christensenellales bacterium]